MSRPPSIPSRGRRIILLDAQDERQWDLDRARVQLADALQDDPMVGHTLMRLADDLGGFAQDPGEALEVVARAIAYGDLVPFAIREPAPAGMRPVVVSGDGESWDDATPLSALRRDAHDDPPPRPQPRPHAPELLDPRDAWLSFEVVDDHGHPADGRYTCTIDGEPHAGPLRRSSEMFRELSTSARARLAVDELRFVPAVFGYDGPAVVPTRPGEPTGPGTVAPARGTLTLEVVDERGTVLRGQYRVTDTDAEHRGELGPVVVIDAPIAPRLRLRLDYSQSPGHRDG